MNVYIVEYDNGESYEDGFSYYGDNVYTDEKDCIDEIIKSGYTYMTTGASLLDEDGGVIYQKPAELIDYDDMYGNGFAKVVKKRLITG